MTTASIILAAAGALAAASFINSAFTKVGQELTRASDGMIKPPENGVKFGPSFYGLDW